MHPILASQIANNLGRANRDATLDIHSGKIYDGKSNVPLSMRPPDSNEIDTPTANAAFLSGTYGDAQSLTFIFAGAGDALVLPRPTTGQRVLLIIENDFPAAVIRVNYDNAAAAAVGIPIAIGGNLFFDRVVPQNDIHIFAPGAGIVQINFMNLDATNPQRVIQANR